MDKKNIESNASTTPTIRKLENYESEIIAYLDCILLFSVQYLWSFMGKFPWQIALKYSYKEL